MGEAASEACRRRVSGQYTGVVRAALHPFSLAQVPNQSTERAHIVEIEVFHVKRNLATYGTVLAVLAVGSPARAQQVADSEFLPPVPFPAYDSGSGPTVLIDEAHFNFHTAGGRYLPFARLLRQDGYVVVASDSKFTRQLLKGADILVISNALAEPNAEDWSLPTSSAFGSDEIRTVLGWVAAGGSLLLIADHMPFPGAAEELAASFGVLFGNGFAMGPEQGRAAMVFRRSDGSLAGHPVTNGREPRERIDSVATFMGQAFRVPLRAAQLLTLPSPSVLLLPERAWQFSEATPRVRADGLAQGALLRHGIGRVAVFGEAAMFSAQVDGRSRSPMGMNAPAASQNPQFLLNVLHWLSGLLEAMTPPQPRE